VLVRCYFKEAEEHRIKLTPHGSSKAGCAIPYLRTYKSTVSKMKNNAGGNRSGVKRVVQEIEGEVGGLEHCNSVGQLPRNERQVKYLKSDSVSRDRWRTPFSRSQKK